MPRQPTASTATPSRRTVFVLGAGADVVYGLSTVGSLMQDLATFAGGEGASIDRALRKRLPHLRFSFDRFAMNSADAFLAQLFADPHDIVPSLRSALEKLKNDPDRHPVGALIEHLCTMAENNQLSGSDLAELAQRAGGTEQIGEAEPLLDPSKLSLSHLPGSVLRGAFGGALTRGGEFTEKERDVLELFIVATSNIEQLLSHYFVRYAAGSVADQKTYLYLVWMLWAFLRVRSAGRPMREDSLYAELPRLGGQVITFNYTNFFYDTMARNVKHFHGRLDRYVRVDDHVVVTDDAGLRAATTVEGVVAFIAGLRLDIKETPAIDMPAIVPPVSFKPVMSREQLRLWAEADDLLQAADRVVIVGYSFAAADEHFNDLLRHCKSGARVLVVNPDLSESAERACRVLDISVETLQSSQREGFDVLSSRRLTCVGAKAEQVNSKFLQEMFR